MDSNDLKMTKFFEDADNTLATINEASEAVTNASRVLKWVASTVILVILAFSVDTRIQVEKKVDTTELTACQNDFKSTYVTKKDVLWIHNLERQYYLQMFSPDSTIVANAKYPQLIYDILQ